MTCKDYSKAIAYYRVSTQKQGQSGLGLAGQEEAVTRYAAANCLTIEQSFTEVETGTSKRQRPEIAKALAAAKELGAVLLIAKLDRLSRSVAFTSALMGSGVKFVAVDMPEANELTIHIMAAMAEHEAKMISQRVTAALEQKRKKDGEWRVSNLDNNARAKGAAANKAAKQAAYGQTIGYASMLRESGLSYAKVAARLNEEGFTTRTGKTFKAMTVKRVLDT